MSKGKSKKEPKKQKPEPKQKETDKAEEEKPFDFGGMPDRDFKKNLGCG